MARPEASSDGVPREVTLGGALETHGPAEQAFRKLERWSPPPPPAGPGREHLNSGIPAVVMVVAVDLMWNFEIALYTQRGFHLFAQQDYCYYSHSRHDLLTLHI